MLKEFQWKYPSYEKNLIPQNNEYLEWLSIMQHYGAPTRLLDFSYSMYVALFMAMDISRQQGLFLVPSSITVSFEEILKSYYNNDLHLELPISELIEWSNLPNSSQTAISILKINIGKENKLRLTNALCQMNITSETMYPGLVGLAQSVRRLREGIGDYKE